MAAIAGQEETTRLAARARYREDFWNDCIVATLWFSAPVVRSDILLNDINQVRTGNELI